MNNSSMIIEAILNNGEVKQDKEKEEGASTPSLPQSLPPPSSMGAPFGKVLPSFGGTTPSPSLPSSSRPSSSTGGETPFGRAVPTFSSPAPPPTPSSSSSTGGWPGLSFARPPPLPSHPHSSLLPSTPSTPSSSLLHQATGKVEKKEDIELKNYERTQESTSMEADFFRDRLVAEGGGARDSREKNRLNDVEKMLEVKREERKKRSKINSSMDEIIRGGLGKEKKCILFEKCAEADICELMLKGEQGVGGGKGRGGGARALLRMMMKSVEKPVKIADWARALRLPLDYEYNIEMNAREAVDMLPRGVVMMKDDYFMMGDGLRGAMDLHKIISSHE